MPPPRNPFEAARQGDITYFMQNGARPSDCRSDYRNNCGRTCLYYACRSNHVKLVRYLVDHGCDPNDIETKTGSTPLHAAAFYGHGKVVQALIGYGAKKNIVNKYGLTAGEEAKTEKIRNLIRHPHRLGTERFVSTGTDVIYVKEGSDGIKSPLHWFTSDPDVIYSMGRSRQDVISHLEMEDDLKFGANHLKRFVDEEDDQWDLQIVKLYTMESAVYKRMNGDLATHNKLSRCLHYAMALGRALWNVCVYETGTYYRSARMCDEEIEMYRECQGTSKSLEWPSYVSTTKDKKLALGWGGNVLLQIVRAKGFDLSPLSQFAHEQEVLILEGYRFRVIEVFPREHDGNSHKFFVRVRSAC